MCDELFDMPPLGSGEPRLLMSNMMALLPDGDKAGRYLVSCFAFVQIAGVDVPAAQSWQLPITRRDDKCHR